jgi:hypothetical protein
MSSDVSLVGFPVARSSKLDEGGVDPSGPVKLSEAARDNGEFW